jgi:PmbA protein
VVRTRDPDVEVFDGEVESLTTASVEGVGIRVITGQRQGLAWAGSLAPDVIDETLKEARDNAGFGEPDEWYGLATLADVNGTKPPVLDLWREELASVPTEEKVRIALDLERATKAADPRIRNVESASYGDALAEAAPPLARRRSRDWRTTRCAVGRDRRRRHGRDRYGLSPAALADLDLDSVPLTPLRACGCSARPIAGRRIQDLRPAGPARCWVCCRARSTASRC